MNGVILGAGFTGMAAGIKTGFPIFEAKDHAGGICRDYIKDGFTFSNGGGHYLFGKGIGLDYVKSLVPVNEIERKAGVYYNHTFPYPFQTAAKADVILDKFGIKPDILKNWLFTNFGREQFNLFFGPFNEKYTAGLYDRIIQIDSYKTPPAGGKGFCPTFCDPVNGLSDLVNKMSEKCNIIYNSPAICIDTKQKIIQFPDRIENYYKLISTIPLNKLMEICGKKIDFPYTSVLVINIGAEPEVNSPKDHWMYIPFCSSGFYRVGFYSNIDKNKAPEGKVSLSVEMAFYNKKYEELDVNKICIDVCQELARWGWIKQVITIDPTWVPCAYTWLYDRESRDSALAWLKERDILSIGRYGKWSFQGMVESIGDGLCLQV